MNYHPVKFGFYKNLEFSFILNCTVLSRVLFYNVMQSRVVSKGKICELLGYYRCGPNLQNSFRLTIHYHAIYCWNVFLGLRMCVYRALINIEIDMMQLVLSQCPWFNAFMSLSVGSSFVNRFMNVRPQVPPTFTRTNAVFLGLSFVIYVIQLHKYIFACRTNP